MLEIRPARADEAETISRLAQASKAHWGYSPEQMAVFRAELTLTAERVVAQRTHVAMDGGALVGFYTLKGAGSGQIELEHVFVDPARLRCGVGRALFRHACQVAAQAGAGELFIQSDPNAAGFYRELGARYLGEIPSSIPGRTIPSFAYDLTMSLE
jgi:GNAT superfamily N-acetyltransferase